jgi:Glycosyltransferase sugar-binding region containing DXD motif
MIPRTIHQLWVGSRPIPAREQAWCAQLAKMNPTWQHRLHGNELLTCYAEDPYVKTLNEQCKSDPRKLAFLSDRLRVLLLRDEGGVYLDADCDPVQSLDTLPIWSRFELDFVYGMRSPHRKDVALHRGIPIIDNTFLSSAKGGRMINRICALWSPARVIVNGHDTGVCIMENADFSCIGLNHRYFYGEQKYPETIVMHDVANLASWAVRPNQQLAHHG